MKLPEDVVLTIKAQLVELDEFADGSARGAYLLDGYAAEDDGPVFTIEIASKVAEGVKSAKGKTLDAVLRETVAAAIRQALYEIVNEHVERAEVEETLMNSGSTFTCHDCGSDFSKAEEHQTVGPHAVTELCHKCYTKRTAS